MSALAQNLPGTVEEATSAAAVARIAAGMSRTFDRRRASLGFAFGLGVVFDLSVAVRLSTAVDVDVENEHRALR